MNFAKSILLMLAISLFACNKHQKISEIEQTLNDGQASVQLLIGNAEFYAQNKPFTGVLLVQDNSLTINLKDDDGGNVILNLEEPNWHKTKPYKVAFNNKYSASAKQGSLMIGKLSKADMNKGEGYVLYDGYFEIEKINTDQIVVKIDGKVSSPFNESNQKSISGLIVWRKPPTDLIQIPENLFAIK